MAALWEKHRQTNAERLAILQGAVGPLRAGELSIAQKQEAAATAHKVAGAAGSFGFTEMSDTARELETLYSGPAALTAEQAEHAAALTQRLGEQLDAAISTD